MNCRKSKATGQLRLRHLMEVTEAVEVEMGEERKRFAQLARDESKPRAVSSFNLFQTPEPLAERVAGMVDLSGRVLEPSAGLGRLYRAIRNAASDSPVTLVEQSAACCAELYREIEPDHCCNLVQGDFLECDAARLGGLFDAIVMNPPFQMWRDIKHIKHALTLLSDGGQLVSLCANGPKQRDQLMPLATEWIDLPAGSFRESGTNVNTAIIVIEK